MDDTADAEQRDKDSTRCEIGSVLENALFDTAILQIAFTPASGRHFEDLSQC